MTQKDQLLSAFDDVWNHRWESFSLAIEGVTEEMAQYQHPLYASLPHEDGYPKQGTILWHVVHLAHCHLHYVDVIVHRPVKTDDPPVQFTDNLADALLIGDSAREALRKSIADLEEKQLTDPISNGDTVMAFIHSVIRHIAWHSGQISVLKRMYNGK